MENDNNVLSIPLHTLKSIFHRLAKSRDPTSFDLIFSLIERQRIIPQRDQSDDMCIINPPSEILGSSLLPPKLYHIYLKFRFNLNYYRDEFPNEDDYTPKEIYALIDSKIAALHWERPCISIHRSILGKAVNSYNKADIATCYEKMEEYNIFDNPSTRLHHIKGCIHAHKQTTDWDGAWLGLETMIKYADTIQIFESFIPYFTSTKNLLLFDEGTDLPHRQTAEEMLSPFNLRLPFIQHRSHNINRVATLLRTMHALKLDPTDSEKICSSMAKYCGFLGLERIMYEWATGKMDHVVMRTNIISAYSMRWARVKQDHELYAPKYNRHVTNILRRQLQELERKIDEHVDVVLARPIDRTLLGLIISFYVRAERLEDAEAVFRSIWDPTKVNLDFLSSRAPKKTDIPSKVALFGKPHSIALYAPLFVAYYQRGDIKRIEKLLLFISDRQLTMDRFFMTRILSRCFARQGDWDSAASLVEQHLNDFKVGSTIKLHPSIGTCILSTAYHRRLQLPWDTTVGAKKVKSHPENNQGNNIRLQSMLQSIDIIRPDPIEVIEDISRVLKNYGMPPVQVDTDLMIHVLKICQQNLVFVEGVYDAWVDGDSRIIKCRPTLQAFTTLMAVFLAKYRVSRVNRHVLGMGALYNLDTFEIYLIDRTRNILLAMQANGMWQRKRLVWMLNKYGLSLADFQMDD